MFGKKGMSPLIITILLIALAVSLGAMIMSWSSGAANSPELTCSDAKLEVQVAFGQELLCYNEADGKLRVIVRNTGSNIIDSLTFRRITLDFKTRDIKLPNSYLGLGKVYESEISFQMEEKVHVEIIPSVIVDGEELLCNDQAIVRDSIPPCPSS